MMNTLPTPVLRQLALAMAGLILAQDLHLLIARHPSDLYSWVEIGLQVTPSLLFAASILATGFLSLPRFVAYFLHTLFFFSGLLALAFACFSIPAFLLIAITMILHICGMIRLENETRGRT